MEPVKQAEKLFKGAFILAAAVLFTKLLSAGYRIPFQNIAGDVGFYIYQQVYPFYGIAIALATTGFPVVLSKLYAERGERGGQLLAASYIILQLFGLVCFAVLYTGAGLIARLMGDPSLFVLIKVVAVVFLLFPPISVLRGYFQGKGDMVPTASSQVGEQVVRVATILFVAVLFTSQGLSLYYVGAGAMFGSITGGIVSLGMLALFFRNRHRDVLAKVSHSLRMPPLKEIKHAAKMLGLQGLAICTASLLMVFIQLGDALNLYSLLVSQGIAPETAKEMKGVFDRGQPLIQLGLAAASAISLSVVPLIASNRLTRDKAVLVHNIRLAMQVTAVIGAGAAAGLWMIAKPANIMLFENAKGTAVLAVLSLAIIFSSVISTASAILQGRGVLFKPAAAILLGFPLKYILNLALVPKFGTLGAAWATALTLCPIAICAILFLKSSIGVAAFQWGFLKKAGVALAAMLIFVKLFLVGTGFLYSTGGERAAAAIQAVGASLFGAFIYALAIVRSGVFRAEDLALFPFGSKLLLLLPKDRSRI
ncbi:putative polysaccharide biosynthesis protein [Bacillus sp. FJAT-27245]|uniref:putative polysaccharide biosynthesis protein n=1 Tax=Bacillus sp. FJAT-27245 TaxID=1684144 RepID=UPI0006A76E90|nr:polysaccharide biosynthesis protein [Bacillus sp. FJAT-27245]